MAFFEVTGLIKIIIIFDVTVLDVGIQVKAYM